MFKMNTDEKLILLVKQHRCLYDLQAPEYAIQKCKHRAWMKISQEMNLSPLECSRKWKTLRDCYRKAVRARHQMLLAGRPCNRAIKFDQSLKFLTPYMVLDREMPPKTDTQLDTNESKLSQIYRHVIEAKKLDNPTDSFFLSMSKKVKEMPREIQTEIERDIFRIVNEAERKLANNCSSTVDETLYLPMACGSNVEVKEEPGSDLEESSIPFVEIKEEVEPDEIFIKMK